MAATVPVGNEIFDPELVRRNLGGLVERCGLAREEFAALGKAEASEPSFGLTPFGLRTSQHANAVSKLHGAVSREMWRGLWPERRVDEVPITSTQDEADADALFTVLEEQVLPAYYERDEAGLPQRWIALMRASIAEPGSRYGTARMVAEYVERLYLPAHEGSRQAQFAGWS